MNAQWNEIVDDPNVRGRDYYSKLRLWFVLIIPLFSLVPLLLVGWVIYLHYSAFVRHGMVDTFRARVDHHRRVIERYLNERSSSIELIARTNSLDHLREKGNLGHVFETMNDRYHGAFTDLGVIDDNGDHLAYVGPYALIDKNYVREHWFKEVMKKGVYISDMFMGFRKVPHFIIAVVRNEHDRRWILRATINTEVFRSLVEDVKIGNTGEVYLLNRDGLFQTRPRFNGEIMGKVSFDIGRPHNGIKVKVPKAGSGCIQQGKSGQILAHAWLKNPRWMLMVKQDYSEAFYDVIRTNYVMLVLLHASALVFLLVSILTARRMIKAIRKRDAEAENLNRQLLHASKLASIGELSAGVAHEINNPLAIIMTERQILLDMLTRGDPPDSDFMNQLELSLSQIQKQLRRCKRTTQNLLRFSRRTTSVIEEIDLNILLAEIVELMEREAGSAGIRFSTDFEPELPRMLSDPSQLQQVFLNLITNAIDAQERKAYGTIHISTEAVAGGKMVSVEVADTGTGILPENLGKVFDPFFTTKPVGKGTGLGLSLCYSTVKRLGGDISVASEPGRGSTFTIRLPLTPPRDKQKRIHDPEGNAGVEAVNKPRRD